MPPFLSEKIAVYRNEVNASSETIRRHPEPSAVAGAGTAHQAKKTAGGRSSSFPRRPRTNRLPCVVCWVRFPAWARPPKGGSMRHFLRDVFAGFQASVLAAVAVHLMNL